MPVVRRPRSRPPVAVPPTEPAPRGWSTRDLVELAGLALLVAAVAVAFGLAPALAAGGTGLVYLSHAWVFGDIPHLRSRNRHIPGGDG